MSDSGVIPLVDLSAELPLYSSEVMTSLQEVIEETQFINGPAVAQFEAAFSIVAQAKATIGAANGTVSLVAALLALGCNPDSTVIVPANSFVATAEAVSLLGASVIFADVVEDTGLLDIEKLSDEVLKAAEFIIPTHLYGQMLDMEALAARCLTFDVEIIEDAAQAHLAAFNGSSPGAYSKFASYSFYPGKNLGAWGDAGALVTNDQVLADIAREICNHGSKSKYDHARLGGNFRIDTFQSVVLLEKLALLQQFTELRRKIANRYLTEISNPMIRLPGVDARAFHVFHLFVVRVTGRESLQEWLTANEVGFGIHYPVCLHQTPVYKDKCTGSFPVAEKISDEILSIPMYPMMSESQVDAVVDVLNRFKG